MNLGRTVFAQLISFLPDREFRRCVARYDGDRGSRSFSCWDQSFEKRVLIHHLIN